MKRALYNISSSIRSAQEQPHDIIAIEVNSLTETEIPYFKVPYYEATWLEKGNLKKILERVLSIKWNGDIIMLFMKTFDGLKGRIILLKKLQ